MALEAGLPRRQTFLPDALKPMGKTHVQACGHGRGPGTEAHAREVQERCGQPVAGPPLAHQDAQGGQVEAQRDHAEVHGNPSARVEHGEREQGRVREEQDETSRAEGRLNAQRGPDHLPRVERAHRGHVGPVVGAPELMAQVLEEGKGQQAAEEGRRADHAEEAEETGGPQTRWQFVRGLRLAPHAGEALLHADVDELQGLLFAREAAPLRGAQLLHPRHVRLARPALGRSNGFLLSLGWPRAECRPVYGKMQSKLVQSTMES
eukprot:5579607-Lingulodinium_polyedra.AAC.1